MEAAACTMETLDNLYYSPMRDRSYITTLVVLTRWVLWGRNQLLDRWVMWGKSQGKADFDMPNSPNWL